MKQNRASIPVRDMLYTALFTAILCVVAPFSISVGPIPLSFATLVIYIAAGSLNWKLSALSVMLYIALGAIGVPVFSNFEGGFYKIAGLTGGFIIGYIPLALATGFSMELAGGKLFFFISGMVIGTVLLYTLGTAWFMLQSGATLTVALMGCVVPFLIGDAIKIAAACAIVPQLRRAIAHYQRGN